MMMRWNNVKYIGRIARNAALANAFNPNAMPCYGRGKCNILPRHTTSMPLGKSDFVPLNYSMPSASSRSGGITLNTTENHFQSRLFAAGATTAARPKKKIPKKEKDRQNQLRYNKRRNDQKRKHGMKKLHKAAKMKRILSACDYWFSRGNLSNDELLRKELQDYAGHVRLSTLASFPKLEHWGDDLGLLYDTLSCEAAKKRYSVVFNREVVERVAWNCRRREIVDKLRKNNRLNDDLGYGFEEEVLPSFIVNDGSSDYTHGFLRPKKVKLEDYTSAGNDEYAKSFSGGEESSTEQVDHKKLTDQEAQPKTDKASLKKYSSNREISIIKNEKQLTSFCKKLNCLIERDGSDAIGFDVEYCSLEEDIRLTLPAMITLSSSDPNGIVGLIWLDKFPNHGKDMLGGDPDCSDLLEMLGDSSISKVGVGTTKDAKHLAAWWGINDHEFASIYLSGMVDMEEMMDNDKLWDKSLQDMCEVVLDRHLPKMKERNARGKRNRRERGKRVKTSHWRRGELTKDMKQYAADDASSAIDTWNKAHLNNEHFV